MAADTAAIAPRFSNRRRFQQTLQNLYFPFQELLPGFDIMKIPGADTRAVIASLISLREGVCMMMTGFGWGFGYLGMILMVIFWGLLIAGGVFVAKAIFSGGTNQQLPGAPSAREILDQRYARGELTREQYELMKQDLA